MSSIKNVTDDMSGAVLAGEAEFKRAMKAANEALADLTVPANLAIPHTFNDEVNHRPAAQQWPACTP